MNDQTMQLLAVLSTRQKRHPAACMLFAAMAATGRITRRIAIKTRTATESSEIQYPLCGDNDT